MVENCNFDIQNVYGCYHFVKLLHTEEHKNYIIQHHKLSVPLSLCLYQIAFANNTDYEIAKDKQNSFMHSFLEGNQSNFLGGLLAF